MRRTLIAAAVGLFALAAVPVYAMPTAPLSGFEPSVVLVAGGCGAGFHRGPNGGCRRNGYGAAAPVYHYHGGRRCWWRGGIRVCN
jgi:hypothetical protein